MLGKSSNSIIANDGVQLFNTHFGNIVRLLEVSVDIGDVPWRNAEKLLTLEERRETCLGYGDSAVSGSSRGPKLRNKILLTARDIVKLGIKDPALFALLSMLEEGVGADTVGDMTTNAILPALAEATAIFCNEHRIPLAERIISGKRLLLPINPFDTHRAGIVLVPLDILGDLPLAQTRDDVSRVCAENEEIRSRVNEMLGDIAKATIRQRKRAIRDYALTDADSFRKLLDEVLGLSDEAYDANFDPEGYLVLRKALSTLAALYPLYIPQPKKSLDGLRAVVDQIIEHFKNLVENNDLHELLWYGKKPRTERAAQKLFYGIADSYCKANNIDISPETNHGGGPVDFKFSIGYSGRVLVEVKLSTGKVKHGYFKQLGVYQQAASTEEAIFLVIDVGGMGNKLEEITKLQRDARLKRQRAADIVVVDAVPKPSASKR